MTADRSTLLDATMMIDGEPVDASERISVTNPARYSETVGTIPKGHASHVDQAVQAAARAFPKWAALDPSERAARLEQAAAAVEHRQDELARLLVRENGKVWRDAVRDVAGAWDQVRYFNRRLDFFEERVLQDARGEFYLRRVPLGVNALIVPWNGPVRLAFLTVAPNLLAGNTLVVKPAPDSPLTLIQVIHKFAAQLPPGVLNVVTGWGAEVGEALTSHPLVRKIHFTGSTETGKRVMESASRGVKRVMLELGGNDPAIVLEDADLERAASGLIRGVFSSAGQICFDVKRIYVQESVYNKFVAAFTEKASQLNIGNGFDERAFYGPVNNAAQYEKVTGLIEEARAAGYRVQEVGHKLNPDEWEHGYFILPTIVTDLPYDATLVSCEQFGPVIPIMPFQDEAQAVQLANNTEFGLGSSIWSQDEARALRLASMIESGSTYINAHEPRVNVMDMPTGGMKQSGIGRTKGEFGLVEQTETKAILVRRDL